MEKQNQISQTNKAKRNGNEGIQKIRLVGSNSRQSLLLLCLTEKKNMPEIKTNPKHYPFSSFVIMTFFYHTKDDKDHHD